MEAIIYCTKDNLYAIFECNGKPFYTKFKKL